MAIQVALEVFINNRLSTDQHSRDEELDFIRLTASLAKTVKKANKMLSDG